MKSYLSVIFTIVLVRMSSAQQCSAIKNCLVPTRDVLARLDGDRPSFLLSSVRHLMSLLDDNVEHGQVLHVSPLLDVVAPIDEFLHDPEGLAELCPVANRTAKCLERAGSCGGDDIDNELEGLKEVLQQVCLDTTRAVLSRDACVFSNTTKQELKTCEQSLNQSITSMQLDHECMNSDNITEACLEMVAESGSKLLTTGLVIPYTNDRRSLGYQSQICTAVMTALDCHKSVILHQCSQEAADWDNALRNPLVMDAIREVNCDDMDDNSSCFGCDGMACKIGVDRLCDGNADCEDGSDEGKRLCDTTSGKEGSTSTATIVLSLLLSVLLLGLAALCLMKVIQERRFSQHHDVLNNTDELIDIVNEEASVGCSTPPPTNYASHRDEAYIYKPVRS